jgi:hypothetical protein
MPEDKYYFKSKEVSESLWVGSHFEHFGIVRPKYNFKNVIFSDSINHENANFPILLVIMGIKILNNLIDKKDTCYCFIYILSFSSLLSTVILFLSLVYSFEPYSAACSLHCYTVPQIFLSITGLYLCFPSCDPVTLYQFSCPSYNLMSSSTSFFFFCV